LTNLIQGKAVQQGQQSEASSFERMLKLDAPNQITSKVIDRARMMVKEGGGQVILDLGTKELGKLELAMNVNNNKVELKILAASDQVRELLSQDIGTLRESLAIEDLNLSEVEVGVGNRDPQGEQFDHSSSEFADSNSQNGRDSGSNQSSTGREQLKRPMIRKPSHDGRIQVQA
jgi:flagellar hook-length control protein FliK